MAKLYFLPARTRTWGIQIEGRESMTQQCRFMEFIRPYEGICAMEKASFFQYPDLPVPESRGLRQVPANSFDHFVRRLASCRTKLKAAPNTSSVSKSVFKENSLSSLSVRAKLVVGEQVPILAKPESLFPCHRHFEKHEETSTDTSEPLGTRRLSLFRTFTATRIECL